MMIKTASYSSFDNDHLLNGNYEAKISCDSRKCTDSSLEIVHGKRNGSRELSATCYNQIYDELLHHNEYLHTPLEIVPLNGFFDDDKSSIHESARIGDLDALQRYIHDGGNVDVRHCSLDITPLHAACQSGQLEAVILLLNAGACIEVEDSRLCTPLHRAATDGHTQIVAELLRRGANVDCQDSTLRTPLHRAARWGHKYTCELLLKYGANLEARDGRFARTPLHYACSAGGCNTLNLLLQYGANIDAITSVGNTGLHLACDRCILEKVRLLMEWGADPYATNVKGQTCFDVIGQWGGSNIRQNITDSLHNLCKLDGNGAHYGRNNLKNTSEHSKVLSVTEENQEESNVGMKSSKRTKSFNGQKGKNNGIITKSCCALQ